MAPKGVQKVVEPVVGVFLETDGKAPDLRVGWMGETSRLT